jgi:hypothetical protein
MYLFNCYQPLIHKITNRQLINMILKLKHWKLFIAFILTLILNVIFAEASMNELKVLSAILGLIILFGWILAVGIQLNRQKDNPFHFSNALFIFSILCCFFGYAEMHISSLDSLPFDIPIIIKMILMPLSFFGIFYSYKNVAKSLKSLEKGRQVIAGEYIIDSILFFAFPIGIWFIQPRLNKLKTESK